MVLCIETYENHNLHVFTVFEGFRICFSYLCDTLIHISYNFYSSPLDLNLIPKHQTRITP